MNKETFIRDVIRDLPEYLPEEWAERISIRETSVVKMNDQSMNGIVLEQPEDPASPTVYLDDWYERWTNGESYDKLMQEFADICAIALNAKPPQLEDLRIDPKNVKDQLSVRVIGGDLNRAYLREVPALEVAPGIMMICEIRVPDGRGGQWRAKISESMMEEIGCDLMQLMQDGIRSSMKSDPAVLMDPIGPDSIRGNLLLRKSPIEGESVMYVLTTQEMLLGAVALFYPGIRERIYHLMGGGYYAIPSSVHEFLIVPMSAGIPPSSLHEMLLDANQTIVEPKDILCDDLYYYESETDRICRAEFGEMIS